MSITPDDLKQLTPDWVKLLDWRKEWLEKAHPYQLTPTGDDWDIWMLLAGRGSGKTYCASNEYGWMALTDPESRNLVTAPTSSDVRDTCFEGASGLLNVLPPWAIKEYNKSLHELLLFNDALIKGIPGGEPERFRGPNFHRAWCLVPGTQISVANGQRSIEKIRAGDSVRTRYGLRKVLAAGVSTNPAPLVKISFGLTSLTGTEDHPILTESGWVPLGRLKIGDRICLANSTAEINRVEKFPNSITYNLTIEGVREYVANGVVVHNCDELAAFQYPQTAWDLLTLSVRLGERTKIIITTTPKPIPLLRDLMRKEGKGVVVSRASTYDNLKNLASNFKDQILRFEGTQLGRQEVYGELLDLAESGILKKSWFKLFPADQELPYFETILISLDTAMTVNTHSDFTACTVWGVFKRKDPETEKSTTHALLLDCWSEKLTYPDLRDRAKEAWLCHYGGANGGKGQLPSTFLIEDKGSGISLRQDLQSEMIPVAAFNPGHSDKVQRANLAAPILKGGFIWLPESEKRPGEFKNWIDPMMDELTIFPADDAHDDFVDSAVQSWHYLYSAGFLHAPLKADRDEDLIEQEFDYAKKRRNVLNPYAQ